jgi:hypothetical protein
MAIIKDASGRVIGETKQIGGRETMFSAGGRNLGSYDAKTNKTYDSAGRVVSQQGNTLAKLLK